MPPSENSGYIVNGLKGGDDGINFDASRDIVTQNNSPSAGGRATIGNRWIRLGSSVIGGRFNNNPVDTGAFPGRLNYLIFGFDAVARYENLLRFHFEYAQRNTDFIPPVTPPAPSVMAVEKVCGYYFEAEGRLRNDSKFSLLGRWDHMNRLLEVTA